MLKHADGRPAPRTRSLDSFRKYQEAVAQVGGRHPAGMAWSEARGWHPSGSASRPVS